MMKQKISFVHIISLLLVFLIYSCANIFMKLSSGEDSIIMSGVYFACTIGILGIYACLWQQILKHIPLNYGIYVQKHYGALWNVLCLYALPRSHYGK